MKCKKKKYPKKLHVFNELMNLKTIKRKWAQRLWYSEAVQYKKTTFLSTSIISFFTS